MFIVSKISSKQFNEVLSELFNVIKVTSHNLFKEFESKAKNLIHDKDIPIFALALKLNCPIWSNEPGFKEQSSFNKNNPSL